VFSPDSKYVAYAVQMDCKELLVCNGLEDKAYDWIFESFNWEINWFSSTIIFDSPNSLHYLAESGNSIYLVEKTIKKGKM